MRDNYQIEVETFKVLEAYQKHFGNKFIIGVSGGGDSLALAAICAKYRLLHPEFEFAAAIVDHNIAKNSASVAQNAKVTLSKIGINANILKVNEKIKAPIQENARNARFEKLTDFANQYGTMNIMLAHNFDDQIETLIFRLLRQTNILGLGAISSIKPNYQFASPTIMLRPLMDFSRHELRNYLNYIKLPYYDDPANENTKFSRVAIRKALLDLKIDTQKLFAITQSAQKLRAILDTQAFEFIKINLSFLESEIQIYKSGFSKLAKPLAIHTLSQIIMALNNSKHPINEAKIIALLENLLSPKPKKMNCANLMFHPTKNLIAIKLDNPRKNTKNPQEFPLKKIFYSRLAARLNQSQAFINYTNMQ
jgi:tRNA(Ile)-lysidine synthase